MVNVKKKKTQKTKRNESLQYNFTNGHHFFFILYFYAHYYRCTTYDERPVQC